MLPFVLIFIILLRKTLFLHKKKPCHSLLYFMSIEVLLNAIFESIKLPINRRRKDFFFLLAVKIRIKGFENAFCQSVLFFRKRNIYVYKTNCLLVKYMNVCMPSPAFFAAHASFMCFIRFSFSIPINVT